MEYRYPIFVISEINILRIAIIRDLTRNIDDYFLIPFYRSSISCWNNVSLIRPVHVDLQIISLANFSYCELPHKSSSIRILVYIFALRAQTFFSRTFFDSPRNWCTAETISRHLHEARNNISNIWNRRFFRWRKSSFYVRRKWKEKGGRENKKARSMLEEFFPPSPYFSYWEAVTLTSP